ncbi:MAG: hypothetical protein J5658_03625 [Prevotella sp.]|nr:hypothetical protein [Prevotella sp.]
MIYHITYDASRHKVACRVKNRKELLRLRNARENLRHLKAFRKGDKKEKMKLLQLAYNAWPVNGLLAGCEHVSSTFFHDIDCYKPEQAEQMKETILSKKEELGLLMLERSASGGWHLVCRRERGKTILENQVRVARILKMEMDTSAHDLQRVVFSTSGSEEDLPYLDDAIFDEPMSDAESAEEYLRLRERESRGEEDLPPEAKKANKHYRPWEEKKTYPQPLPKMEGSGQSQGQGEALLFKDVPYERIIAEWWRQNGGEPSEGERNTELHRLAVNLRTICDNRKDVLLAVLPRFGLSEQELRGVVDSACKEQPKGKSRALREVLRALGIETRVTTSNDSPPPMPEKVPRLIELLVSNTPDIYKPAVAHAVFPSLAVHLCKVYFRYIDNKRHEATLMNVLMAGTGAGKDCISEPIDHIMADIRKRDAENLRREKEWKDEVSSKGANKDKKKRPEGLVIQEIDADMTNPAFVMRTAEAEEHFLYVKLNEIDQFDALKGNGRQGAQFQIMCLAFDPNNRYGQTRIGTQSVTERVQIRFNWNACTTIQKGQRYFQRVLTDGPISRINFCTIPEREIGAEIPVYGEYTEAFDEELKPYIERLCAAHGEIECRQAFELAQQLNRECAEMAALSQSRVYENLSFRANVIAYLKACVLYVANGCQWDDTFEAFIRWSLQYDMWCKMEFFGHGILSADQVVESGTHPGPQGLLSQLPEFFTKDDALRVRRMLGLGEDRKNNMISTWKKRNYILQMADGSYQNLKFKKKE